MMVGVLLGVFLQGIFIEGGSFTPLYGLDKDQKRLYNLSFDPNHAPELRWGAPENSQEREGMVMLRTPLKSGGSLSTLESYDKEEILRFNLTRQSTPTSLNPGDNANRKQYQTIDEMLSGKLNLIKPNL